MKLRLLPISVLFTGLSALAQERLLDSITPSELDEVVVTGQFQPQPVSKSIRNVRVITRQDIEKLAGNNLADVLSQSLNITVTPNTATGRSTVSLFGLNGQYFKVFRDNVPVVSDSGLGNDIDLTQINLDDVERIEIIEGSMGVVYGANAVSGVLNIITRKTAAHDWEVAATLQEETVSDEYALMSKGRHIQGLRAAHRISPGWFASVTFNRNDFTGFLDDRKGKSYAVNDARRGYQWLPEEQYTSNFLLNYTKDGFRIFYRFDYLDGATNFYNRSVYTVPNPPFDEVKYADDENYLTRRFYHLLNFEGRLFSKLRYNVSVSHQKQQRDIEAFNYNLDTGSAENKVRNTDQSSEVLYSTGTLGNFFTGKKVDLQLGYEAVNNIGFARVLSENNFVKEIRQRFENYDLFLSAEIKASERLSIRPGVRYSFQSKFDNQYAASLGLRYSFDKNLEARLSFGRSYRTPNFEELYFEFIIPGHYYVGNKDLVPENSLSYEANLKKTVNINGVKATTDVTANFIHVSDRIEMALVELNPPKSQYINISKYQVTNVAWTGQVEWEKISVNTGVSVSGISQEINNGEAVSDDDFLYTLQLSASLSYALPKYGTQFSIYYKYTGRTQQYVAVSDENGQPDFKLGEVASFGWMTASVRQRFLKNKFDLTFGARNLLDVTNVRQTTPNAGTAHLVEGSIMLGYGRSYFLKLIYNLNI